jgi:hypothetical protein
VLEEHLEGGEGDSCEGIELVYKHEKRAGTVHTTFTQTVLAGLGSSRDARSSQGHPNHMWQAVRALSSKREACRPTPGLSGPDPCRNDAPAALCLQPRSYFGRPHAPSAVSCLKTAGRRFLSVSSCSSPVVAQPGVSRVESRESWYCCCRRRRSLGQTLSCLAGSRSSARTRGGITSW